MKQACRISRSALLAGLLALCSVAAIAGSPADIEAMAWRYADEANVASGYRAYLAEYPKGRFAAAARIKLAGLGATIAEPAGSVADKPGGMQTKDKAIRPEFAPANTASLPPQPNFPEKLSDEVWAKIAHSDLLKMQPRGGRMGLSYIHRTETESAIYARTELHQKQLTLAPYANDARFSEKAERDDIRHTATKKNSLFGVGDKEENRQAVSMSLNLGVMPLFGVYNKNLIMITRVHELQGSLFPLKVGNKLRFDIELSNLANQKLVDRQMQLCEVSGTVAANTIRKEFSGNAWVIRCELRRGNSQAIAGEHHFIEALGVSTSDFGIWNLGTNSYVVPQESAIDFEHGSDYQKQVHAIEGYTLQFGN